MELQHERSHSVSRGEGASQKRQKRANRILDAAAELLLAWGHDKTTLDDIARRAGVAKGTIYLHWKTREDLFMALINKERILSAGEVKERLMNDPEGATLHGIIKHSTIVILKRPLMKALLTRDTTMLGRIVQHKYALMLYQDVIKRDEDLLTFLQYHGQVRVEIDMREQIYMLTAVRMGYILAESLMPPGYEFAPEKVGEMPADTLQRVFEIGEMKGGSQNSDEVLIKLNQFIEGEMNY